MGLGDDLMITSIAKIEKEKFPDRQIIIGNYKKKIAYYSIVYENNPNITNPENIDNLKPIHYINYHPENRPYVNRLKSTKNNWSWNYDFRPIPGEIYFSELENSKAKQILDDAKSFWKKNNFDNYKGIIFLESSSSKLKDQQFSVKHQNKDWSYENWFNLIKKLSSEYLIIQSVHLETKKIPDVYFCDQNFRISCAVMNKTDLYVGHEGGFGHVAAALNKKAVIYFGGWIDPKVIGYDFHKNIYVNIAGSPCGSMTYLCDHCINCRSKITPDYLYKIIVNEIS